MHAFLMKRVHKIQIKLTCNFIKCAYSLLNLLLKKKRKKGTSQGYADLCKTNQLIIRSRHEARF